jgi:DNA-binding MarR family transcriptional regulator
VPESADSEPPTAAERTPAGDALTRVVVGVIQLYGPLIAAGDALARPVAQSSARWQVLAGIEDGPTTVASIARRLGLARQSVQRVADLVVGDGLAVYEDNPGHRRAKLLRITPEGSAVLGRIQAAQRAWANELGKEVGESGLRQASVALERLLGALRARPKGR